jgi:hypothetical protein
MYICMYVCMYRMKLQRIVSTNCHTVRDKKQKNLQEICSSLTKQIRPLMVVFWTTAVKGNEFYLSILPVHTNIATCQYKIACHGRYLDKQHKLKCHYNALFNMQNATRTPPHKHSFWFSNGFPDYVKFASLC